MATDEAALTRELPRALLRFPSVSDSTMCSGRETVKFTTSTNPKDDYSRKKWQQLRNRKTIKQQNLNIRKDSVWEETRKKNLSG